MRLGHLWSSTGEGVFHIGLKGTVMAQSIFLVEWVRILSLGGESIENTSKWENICPRHLSLAGQRRKSGEEEVEKEGQRQMLC